MLSLLHYKRCEGMLCARIRVCLGRWARINTQMNIQAEDTEIEVQGTFETYKEKDYDTTFCRLANVDMRVKE